MLYVYVGIIKGERKLIPNNCKFINEHKAAFINVKNPKQPVS